MKTITFLYLSVFTATKLYSQSYEIDFAGTGDTTVVDGVFVENLNQGISLTLNGDDILKLNITTGIHNDVCDIKSLQIYPNPMTDQAEIHFFVSKSGNVLMGIYDISGRSVIKSNKFMLSGVHKFRVSGLHQGMYIVRINEQNSFYTAKLISQNQLNGEAEIEYVSSENIQLNQTQTKQLKSTASTIEMPYHEGDRLLFKGMTGSYATIITDVPSGNNTITFDFMDCTDADDNHYAVVKIGTQVWMAVNLRTTRYNNLDTIETTTPDTLDISSEGTPKYQWTYKGNESKVTSYGILYTWFAATDDRSVCPIGWHLPTDAEWTTLVNYLGGEDVAGSKLKETGTNNWFMPNTDATNETGFSALPGGTRNCTGPFEYYGDSGTWWSSTEDEIDDSDAWLLHLMFDYGGATRPNFYKSNGLSVRCVMD